MKCVVWDLDDTLWDGILLEDGNVRIRPDVVKLIIQLDDVGILNSIASRNDHDAAMAVLEAADLSQYFLFPQISWNPKSKSVATIAEKLNIGIDSLAFVDDQAFELAEVAQAHPEVLCVPSEEIFEAARRPEFQPDFITPESRARRQMYWETIRRDVAEDEFEGTSEEFLATTGLKVTIVPARREDLERAYELVATTNQLNSTGKVYPYSELERLVDSPDHALLVSSLEDNFGTYGKIGFALVEKHEDYWHLRLLLMSCRVMSRGVGTVFLYHIMGLAKNEGVRLLADFVDRGRNRLMYVTYKFAGFCEIERLDNEVVLASDLATVPPIPSFVTLLSDDADSVVSR